MAQSESWVIGADPSGLVTPDATTEDVSRTASGTRLGFLDALRGVAVLCVVAQHAIAGTSSAVLASWTDDWWRMGQLGVLVFFLCSGFIIPASLERKGSVRQFWIGRFFRLFPLYWAAIAACVVLHTFGLYDYDGNVGPLALVANLSMMQLLLAQPLVIGASWSLAYEMVFYWSTSALFLAKVHNRSWELAATFTLTSLAAGTYDKGPVGLLVAVGSLLAAAALCVAVLRNVAPGRRVLLVVLAALILPWLVVTKAHEAWFNLELLALMFLGTVAYRWAHGQYAGRTLVATCSGVTAGLVVVTVLNPTVAEGGSSLWFRPAPFTILGALAVFFAGLSLRRRAMPRWLAWVGLVSYSAYLVHPVVLGLLPLHVGAASAPLGIALVVAVTLAASALTYRAIERPAIGWGRRLATLAPRRDATPARISLTQTAHVDQPSSAQADAAVST